MHRNKKRAAKAASNISLHFNDLKHTDSVIDDEQSVSAHSLVEEPDSTDGTEKNNNRIKTEMNSKKILPEQGFVGVDETNSVKQIVDPLMELPVNEEILVQDAKLFHSITNKKAIDPSTSNEVHQAKEERNEYDISAGKYEDRNDRNVLFPEPLPSEYSATENSVSRSTSTSLGKAPASQLSQLVEDHPLAVQNSDLSSDEEDEFENEIVAKQKYSPRIKGKKPPRPPPPDLLHESNSSKQSVAMISSALFNPKARTKLFSTIKRNIQHYTGSGVADNPQAKAFQYARFAGSSDFDTVHDDDLDNEAKSESQAGDIFSHLSFSTDNSMMKGWRGKVVEPLQAMKRAWEDVPKETPQNEPESRKRSSSESNFTSAPQPRLEPRYSLEHSETERLSSPRSKTVSMTFSSLAEKQERKEGDVKSPVNRGSQKDIPAASQSKVDVWKERAKHSGEQIQDIDIHDEEEDNYAESSDSISLFGLLMLSCSVYAFLILPKPPYLIIAVYCFIIGSLSTSLFLCLFVSNKKHVPAPIRLPYINLSIPHQIPTSLYDPTQPFKGWMNEMQRYDVDTYHISCTRSVFVTLEGSTLRFQTPRRNIARRATFGEGSIPVSNVIHQRLYNVSNAKVYLVPHGLVKKRVWSKKYPICIEFTPSYISKNAVADSKVQKKAAKSSADSYDIIDEEDMVEKVYLFGRTERQKEEWFYRFQRAIAIALSTSAKETEAAKQVTNAEKKNSESASHFDSCKSDEVSQKLVSNKDKTSFDPTATYRDYYMSMCRLLPDPAVYTVVKSGASAPEAKKDVITSDSVHFSSPSNPYDGGASGVVLSQPRQVLRSPSPDEPGLEVAWFNVVIGRIMFDFLRRPKWADWLSTKIQKKLEKIKLPYFMDGLKLTEMDLGTTIPLVHKISLPKIDSQGVWLDMEITYSGAVQMTLETKMVLTKLGKQHPILTVDKKKLDDTSAITNSDEEDSAESSDDEDEASAVSRLVDQVQLAVPSDSAFSSPLNYLTASSNDNQPPTKAKERSKTLASVGATSSAPSTPQQEKRWVRIVDSITKSKYFQRATENKYIRKKLETVSNTPLVLTAELLQCQGTLCINIPPPPSDRIWYGFKDQPLMHLRALPKFGERAFTSNPVTDWIEKKLLQEFNKFLLLPNMDDIPIPLMFSNLPTGDKKSSD